MILWVGVFIVLFLLSQYKRYNPWIFWSCVTVMILLAGFRDVSIGVDTQSYRRGMTYLAMGLHPYTEQGWVLLNRFIINHGNDFHMLKLLVAVLTIVPIALVFVYKSERPQLSLFIYYALYIYLNSFNLMRQMLAVSIVFVAYAFFMDKRYILTLVMMFIAYQFHHSAMYAVSIFALPFIKLNRDSLVYITLGLTLLMGCFMSVMEVAFTLGSYQEYLSGKFSVREGFLMGFIMSVLMNALFIYLYIKTDRENKNTLLFKIFFLAIIMNNLTFRLVLGSRIILFFTIIQTLLYPKYFSPRYQYTKWLIVTYMTVLFMKIMIASIGVPNDVFPYKWVLGNYLYY